MIAMDKHVKCFVNLKLHFVLWMVIVSTSALDTSAGTIGGVGTVAPLSADHPAGSEKDYKKFDSDPQPEYYKPTSPPSANNYDSYSDLKFNGQSHRPAGFLSGTNGYFNPYLQKHGFYGPINPKDRVSIGGGYYSGSEFTNGGTGYVGSDRVRPYGSPQPVDVPPTGYNANGYYGGGAGAVGGGDGYGVPGAYDGGTYDMGYDGNSWPDKMNHLSKSHLLPLAGAALIGIAAALLVNPVLLQLGTVSGKRRRRRRRRDVLSRETLPASQLSAHNLAYSGQTATTTPTTLAP